VTPNNANTSPPSPDRNNAHAPAKHGEHSVFIRGFRFVMSDKQDCPKTPTPFIGLSGGIHQIYLSILEQLNFVRFGLSRNHDEQIAWSGSVSIDRNRQWNNENIKAKLTFEGYRSGGGYFSGIVVVDSGTFTTLFGVGCPREQFFGVVVFLHLYPAH
jgi:hypothetical protein